MSAADYYPAGAYNDPNAPWNQTEETYVNVEVECTNIMVWKGCIDVIGSESTWCEREKSDEGYENVFCSETNLEESLDDAFARECYSIPNLLGELKKRLENELNECESESQKHKLQQMIFDIDCWDIDDYYCEQK